LGSLAAQIVLVDLDRDCAAGEAMELGHEVPSSHPTRIWAGDYADCAGALTVITARRIRRLAKHGSTWSAATPGSSSKWFRDSSRRTPTG
jgi:malate/lactate dehydrogenase